MPASPSLEKVTNQLFLTDLVWRVEVVRDNQILEICLKKQVELLRQKELDEANHSPLAHRRKVFARSHPSKNKRCQPYLLHLAAAAAQDGATASEGDKLF
jgi:hypothetical protein